MKFTQPDKEGVSHVVLEGKEAVFCDDSSIYNWTDNRRHLPLTDEPIGTVCEKCRRKIEIEVEGYKRLFEFWQKYLNRLNILSCAC